MECERLKDGTCKDGICPIKAGNLCCITCPSSNFCEYVCPVVLRQRYLADPFTKAVYVRLSDGNAYSIDELTEMFHTDKNSMFNVLQDMEENFAVTSKKIKGSWYYLAVLK